MSQAPNQGRSGRTGRSWSNTRPNWPSSRESAKVPQMSPQNYPNSPESGSMALRLAELAPDWLQHWRRNRPNWPKSPEDGRNRPTRSGRVQTNEPSNSPVKICAVGSRLDLWWVKIVVGAAPRRGDAGPTPRNTSQTPPPPYLGHLQPWPGANFPFRLCV